MGQTISNYDFLGYPATVAYVAGVDITGCKINMECVTSSMTGILVWRFTSNEDKEMATENRQLE